MPVEPPDQPIRYEIEQLSGTVTGLCAAEYVERWQQLDRDMARIVTNALLESFLKSARVLIEFLGGRRHTDARDVSPIDIGEKDWTSPKAAELRELLKRDLNLASRGESWGSPRGSWVSSTNTPRPSKKGRPSETD
jgi:hypothetical protein